jgi:hypothetical protein
MYVLDRDGQFDKLIEKPTDIDDSLLLWHHHDVVTIVLELFAQSDYEVAIGFDGQIHIFQATVTRYYDLALDEEVKLILLGVLMDIDLGLKVSALYLYLIQESEIIIVEVILDNTIA